MARHPEGQDRLTWHQVTAQMPVQLVLQLQQKCQLEKRTVRLGLLFPTLWPPSTVQPGTEPYVRGV